MASFFDLSKLLTSIREEAKQHKEAMENLRTGIQSCITIIDTELQRLQGVRDSIEQGIDLLDSAEPDIDNPAYDGWSSNRDRLEDKLFKLGDIIDELEDAKGELTNLL